MSSERLNIFQKKTDVFNPRLLGLAAHTLQKVHAAGLSYSMAELFHSLNIRIDIEGDQSVFTSAGGILLVGSHHQKYETYPLLAVSGSHGRNDMYHIAIPPPFSKSSLVSVFLDPLHFGYVLPVLHRSPDHSVGNFFQKMRTTISNAAFMDDSFCNDLRKKMNFHSLQKAAELLVRGHMVNIFPTGNPDKNMEDHWYPGIGVIISLLNEACGERVQILPHSFDSNLITEVYAAQKDLMDGKKLNERSIHFRIGNPKPAIQFKRTTIEKTTEAVKAFYLQELSPLR